MQDSPLCVRARKKATRQLRAQSALGPRGSPSSWPLPRGRSPGLRETRILCGDAEIRGEDFLRILFGTGARLPMRRKGRLFRRKQWHSLANYPCLGFRLGFSIRFPDGFEQSDLALTGLRPTPRSDSQSVARSDSRTDVKRMAERQLRLRLRRPTGRGSGTWSRLRAACARELQLRLGFSFGLSKRSQKAPDVPLP